MAILFTLRATSFFSPQYLRSYARNNEIQIPTVPDKQMEFEAKEKRSYTMQEEELRSGVPACLFPHEISL